MELNIVGNEEGPYAIGQGAAQDEYGHGQTSVSACISGNHAGAGRMVHGGSDGPQRYKEEKHREGGGKARQRNEKNGQ